MVFFVRSVELSKSRNILVEIRLFFNYVTRPTSEDVRRPVARISEIFGNESRDNRDEDPVILWSVKHGDGSLSHEVSYSQDIPYHSSYSLSSSLLKSVFMD